MMTRASSEGYDQPWHPQSVFAVTEQALDPWLFKAVPAKTQTRLRGSESSLGANTIRYIFSSCGSFFYVKFHTTLHSSASAQCI